MKVTAKMNADGKTETIYLDGRVFISKAKAGRWQFFSRITKEWAEFDLKPVSELGKHTSREAAERFKGTYSKGSHISKREIFEVTR